MTDLKQLLDDECARRNRPEEVCLERPDPILVAGRHRRDDIALICALFSYGNATAIIRFLDRLDFSLLDADETAIQKALAPLYYRFQTGADITALFLAMRRLRQEDALESLFMEGFHQEGNVVGGIGRLIESLNGLVNHDSRGWRFLLSQTPLNDNWKGASPLKRWMMFLRWMVRNDAIDMGLWQKISPKELIIPLDTHTFATATKLGLLTRRRYDLEAARELTETLRSFDPNDPVRYDFALYRLGQERLV